MGGYRFFALPSSRSAAKQQFAGYWISNDVIIEDLPQNDAWNMDWKVIATGVILTDISTTSKLRFNVTLKHTVGNTCYFRVVIGNVVVWEVENTGNIWTPKTNDIAVTWKRGDTISCEMKATNPTGNQKDFQICGYLTPMGLD